MEFITIKENIETEIVEKKSKFIANLLKVDSIKEAEEQIKEIRKKYYDAKHHCIAYRIMEKNQIVEKSRDDGEPSGTAGAPMLAILKNTQLVNIVVVVTRYFGGILLGTGGLVRAYSGALQKAIEESEKIQKCQGFEMIVELEYSDIENFKYYCKNNDISIVNMVYKEIIECKIQLEYKKKEKLLQDFTAKNAIIKNIKNSCEKYITKSI